MSIPNGPVPYYQDEHVTLYHGDCREITAWLDADVLVTDPPYGMAYVSNSSKYGSTAPIAGDDSLALRDAMVHMWGDGPALVFGTWRVDRPTNARHVLVWDKGDSPGMGDLSLPWGPSWEEIYVLGKGFTGRRGGAVLRVNTISAGSNERPDHPTPKPVPLMERLIERCPPGVIADPFAGSGSTLLAAANLGRKAIGVEFEERYCEWIAKRLSSQTMTLDLGGV